MSARILASLIAVVASSIVVPHTSFAEGGAKYGNQIFFRGAYSALTSSRGNEVFTDTLNAAGLSNNDTGGYSIAAGLDISAMHMEEMGDVNLMGEVYAEFSKFSDAAVVQTTSALLGAPTVRQVNVTELNVTIAPKARFDGLGNGRIRPYVIPIGLAFLVNSPPSNNTSYLDIGLHFAGGVDVLVVDRISVGADVRYTQSFDQSHTNNSYWSTGAYVALNF